MTDQMKQADQTTITEIQKTIIKRGEAQCGYCGKPLTENEVYCTDSAEISWIFCSRKCALAAFTAKFFAMKKEGIIKDKSDIEMRVCAWCNTPFEVNSKRPSQIYCSVSCGQKAQYAKKKAARLHANVI